jgi:hypothetical protein
LTSRGSQVRSLSRPPSSPTKPRISSPSQNRPFLRGFSPVSFRTLGLRDICGLSGVFEPPVSASNNSVPRSRVAAGLGRSGSREFWEFFGPKRTFTTRTYRAFNPRASNCRLHSAGASRSRSTPMPRGKRPSTAARTRSGARNASEIVMLTWRALHFWRLAIC